MLLKSVGNALKGVKAQQGRQSPANPISGILWTFGTHVFWLVLSRIRLRRAPGLPALGSDITAHWNLQRRDRA